VRLEVTKRKAKANAARTKEKPVNAAGEWGGKSLNQVRDLLAECRMLRPAVFPVFPIFLIFFPFWCCFVSFSFGFLAALGKSEIEITYTPRWSRYKN